MFLLSICFGIFMISLSAVGYINLFRCRFRLKFCSAAFLWISSLSTVMMITGILHINMSFVSWIIELFGLCLLFIPEKLDKNSLYENLLKPKKILKYVVSYSFKKNLKDNIFRTEYLFLFLIILGVRLFQFSLPCFYEGDTANAFLPQFQYLLEHKTWTDSGFRNYASAYALIGSGIGFFISSITFNVGFDNFNYGYYLLCIFSLMMLIDLINWKRVNFFVCVSYILVCIYCIVQKKWEICTIINLCALTLCVIRYNIFKKIKDPVIFFLWIPFSLFIAGVSYYDIWIYPLDCALGLFTVGTIIYIFNNLSFKKIFTFVPVLFTLTFIKPTGLISSVWMGLVLFVSGALWIAKHYKIKSCRKCFLKALGILLVSLTPVFANYMWSFYSNCNGFQYQNHVNKNWKDDFSRHLQYGLNNSEKDYLSKKINKMSIPYTTFEKNILIHFFEMNLANFIRSSGWDYDRAFEYIQDNTHFQKSHILVYIIISLFLSMILVACRPKEIWRNGLLIIYVYLFLILSLFIQCFFTPMYFGETPGLFRYIYPAFSLCIALPFFLLTLVVKKSYRLLAISVSFVFLFLLNVIFSPKHVYIYQKKPNDNSFPLTVWQVLNHAHYYPEYSFFCRKNTTPMSRFLAVLWNQAIDKQMAAANENIIDSNKHFFIPFFVYNFPPDFYSYEKYASAEKIGLRYFNGKMISEQKDLVTFQINQDGLKLLNRCFNIKDMSSLDFHQIMTYRHKDSFLSDGSWSLIIDDYRYNQCPPEKKVENIFYCSLWNFFFIKFYPTESPKRLLESHYHYMFMKDTIELSGVCKGDKKIHVLFSSCNRFGDNGFKTVSIQDVEMKWNGNHFTAMARIDHLPENLRGEYYRWEISVPQKSESEIYNLKHVQYVSGITDSKFLKNIIEETNR